MIVHAIERKQGYISGIVRVEISDYCPKCAAEGKTTPRGEPKSYNFHEDGDWYNCDRWSNSCGHIDYYEDVLKESRAA